MSEAVASPEVRPDAEQQHADVHVVPPSVLIAVWAILAVLTVVTVAVTYVDLGRLNIWVALAIAAVKASLVLLYFMHLRYDSPLNAFIFIVALAFVSLFIVGTITDTRAYQDVLSPPMGINTP
jgi:cytochrome c oxidase subunit IV